jgi:phospholipase/carboxylesterase
MTYLQRELDDRVVLEPGSGVDPNAGIIWLHGLGADGYDFVPIVPQLRLPQGCEPRFVFPHAPIRAVTINGGMRMRAWYDILGFSRGDREDASGIRESVARIEQILGDEQKGGIPADRIVLAGFSQGGAIALHTGLRHAQALAGILSLSAWLPLQDTLGEASAANRRTPILMGHGRYDPVVPMELAEASRDLLVARGYPVEFKAYPMEHQVCPEEISDISDWLCRVLAEKPPR